MSESGELDYLDPDFDPNTLTVPKLRNILLEYNVNYPSSAKKTQLVDLFVEHVKPTAQSVLKARARTKPSARGIVDVPSSQVSVADEEEDDLPEPATIKAKRVTSKRSTRQPTEESDAGMLAPPATVERRTSNRLSRTPEPTREAPPTVKKSTRKSVAPTPARKIKSESPDPDAWRVEADDSPFTQDNPFQSGSSPLNLENTNNAVHRRITADLSSFRSKEKATPAARRRTDGPIISRASSHTNDDGDVSMQFTREMAVARTAKKTPPTSRKRKEETPDEIEAGEEFAPEEQEELALERANQGGQELVPARKKRKTQSSASLKSALATTFIAALAGTSFIWVKEKFEVGYCGIGRPTSNTIQGIEVPEWADFVLPQCEQCPQHAYCYPNMEVTCERGFVLTPHPLTANGVLPLPLPPTCEPDTEKAKRVKAVADRAIEQLRERNAAVECRTLLDDHGKHVKTADLPIASLKDTVSSMRKRSMSQEEFDNLWIEAIGEIEGREETVKGTDPSGQPTLKSNSLARIPLTCAIRRSIREALVKYLWPIIGLFLLIASGGYTRYTITYNRETESRAKQLASYALDRLSTQAALHARDPSTYPENFISMTHLRDDVLRDEFSAKRRLKLWDKVQKKVEGNSNIRPMVREGRHGDRSRVWEWVGAVGLLEDAPGSVRRDTGSRFSFGGVSSSPASAIMSPQASGPVAGGGEKEMVQRKWEEGRPIY